MEARNPSRTAFMTAFLRGYHTLHDSPKIINDSLALDLVPDEVREALEKHLAQSSAQMAPDQTAENMDHETALQSGIRTMAGPILARARYVEDRLEEAVRQGVSQYVILGAGFETFAYRRLDLMDRLQVFEIDLPATQEIKRRLLARIGLPKPDNLHFIPIDFTRDTLVSVLDKSPYDRERPSFFSWTGVTFYLPIEAIRSTLTDVVSLSCAGSEIVFDYWDKSAFDPAAASNRVKSLIESTKTIGEPIITGFDPSTLSAELAGVGLQLIDNLKPSDIQQRYLRGCSGGYSTSKHEHLACARV